MKLNTEEREELYELLGTQGWVLALKVIENMVSKKAQKVLTYNSSEGADGLVRAKCNYEGASQLFLDIRNLKKNLSGD